MLIGASSLQIRKTSIILRHYGYDSLALLKIVIQSLYSTQGDEPPVGNAQVDVEFLKNHLNDGPIEEMNKPWDVMYKQHCDTLRQGLKGSLALPSADGTRVMVHAEVVKAFSTWIRDHPEGLAHLPTEKYPAVVVNIVAASMFDPQYKIAAEDVPDGKTDTEIHMLVYFCATDMGMPNLEGASFKLMRESLHQDGLPITLLWTLVKEHKLFTSDFGRKAQAVPQYDRVMSAFATYIAVHTEDFLQTDVYIELQNFTGAYLHRYIAKAVDEFGSASQM